WSLGRTEPYADWLTGYRRGSARPRRRDQQPVGIEPHRHVPFARGDEAARPATPAGPKDGLGRAREGIHLDIVRWTARPVGTPTRVALVPSNDVAGARVSMSHRSGSLGDPLVLGRRGDLDADRALGAHERLVGAIDGRRPIAPGTLDSDHLVTPRSRIALHHDGGRS